jgi:hypothetical protein
LHVDRATIDATLADWTTAPVSERVRGGLELLEVMCRHPQDIDAKLVASLTRVGLDTEAVEDVANSFLHFSLMNRFSDAFDYPLLDEQQRRKAAKMLDRAARVRVAARPNPSYSCGADGLLRPVEVEHARTVALRGEGVTETALREAVEAYAASWFGGRRSGSTELPEPLRGYVEKVARWAYKVTDEDIEALKRAGYDDPAIFELTHVAALGASMPALERLFGLLHSPSPSPTV